MQTHNSSYLTNKEVKQNLKEINIEVENGKTVQTVNKNNLIFFSPHFLFLKQSKIVQQNSMGKPENGEIAMKAWGRRYGK